MTGFQDMPEKRASGAKAAAEKLGVLGEIGEKHPSGAKARVDFAALTAPFDFAQSL
jgi:hypothetical protein